MTRLALLALTLGALLSRLWGIERLLPHDVEPDARIPYQIEVLRAGELEEFDHRHFGQYPLFFAYLGLLLPRPAPPASKAESSLEEHLAGARVPVLHARRLIAVLGSLLVPLTFLLARLFVDARGSLLAAFLVATSPSHLWYSQQARPHAAFAVLATLAVLGCVGLARGTTWRSWLTAGVFVALALGALHSGIALGIPLVIAAVLRLRRDGMRGLGRVALALGPIVVLFPLFYPFLFFMRDPTTERAASQLDVEGTRLLQAGQVVDFSLFDGRGFWRMLLIFASWEPWLLLGSALGLVWVVTDLARRRRPPPGGELLVVLAHALPYFVVLGLYSRTVIRFCTPLLPSAAVLSAFGLMRLWDRWGPRLSRPVRLVVFGSGGILMLVLPALTALRQSWLGTQPDTEELAARWIEEQRDPNEDRIFVFPYINLPLFADAEALEYAQAPGVGRSRISWWDWQQVHADRVGTAIRWDLRPLPLWDESQRQLASDTPRLFFGSLQADVIVLQGTRALRMGPIVNRLFAWVRANCERLALIGPDRELRADLVPFSYEDPPGGRPVGSHVLRVWGARSLGPVIEIYRAP